MSVGVGTACTLYEPLVVLEALALTGSVTVSLTAYTFWAARKGVTFQKWGPMLFTCARPPPPSSARTACRESSGVSASHRLTSLSVLARSLRSCTPPAD
jgi:hypothetical protein